MGKRDAHIPTCAVGVQWRSQNSTAERDRQRTRKTDRQARKPAVGGHRLGLTSFWFPPDR